MIKDITSTTNVAWSKCELVLFRFGFIFLLLLTIPFNGSYYKDLFSIDIDHLGFQDLFQVTHHIPGIHWFSQNNNGNFTGWIVAFIIAVIATIIWSIIDKNTGNYNKLYYWSRAVLRYRLAIGVIVYGILLLIPAQIPDPSLADLHTPYGDFLPWKIYFHSTAIASAAYRQTIGAIEILGAVLLLFRRTTAFGSIIIMFVLVNIILANFAYDIGDHLYSIYLFVVAAALLIYDLPRLYTLVVKETKTIADRFHPVFTRKTKILKHISRAGLILFSITFLAFTVRDHLYNNWPYLKTPGLENAYGVYNVSYFKINDSLLPYSLYDTTRWKDVVFEKWNVLSVRTNKPVTVNFSNPGIIKKTNYEFIGNSGRTFYQYTTSGDSVELVNPNNNSDKLHFAIVRPDSTIIKLQGITSTGDSLSVVLDKINKQYLLFKGRRKPIAIN